MNYAEYLFFPPDIGNFCIHIIFSVFGEMKGNLMFIALVLSIQLRPKLNMHMCVFAETALQSTGKRTAGLSIEPCIVLRAARVCAWMDRNILD